MKMPLFSSISFVTNIAKGYTLPQALRIAADCGFGHVEIASIAGMCEHVPPGDIDPDYIAALAQALKDHNLASHAFAGHVDMTLEGGLKDFLPKMDLAAGIGCKVINTNAGPAERMDSFRSNIRKVIGRAERLGLTVCLESHGDIIGSAKQAAPLFKEISHPLIRFNYDTGNTYYYAKGGISIEDDILYALDYLAYVHVKDIGIEGDRARYRPLGMGDIDFPKVFASLAQIGRPVSCGLEIPVFVSGTLEALSSAAAPIGEDEIRGAIGHSMEYLKRAGAA
jgi:sugar phosphate isomerase/epimerase